MKPLRTLLFLLVLLAAHGAQAQPIAADRHIASQLIAETDTPGAGEVVTLALVMRPDEGWHGYWKNPGDAGYGMKIAWRLPPGVSAGPIAYPVPERLIVAGYMNYVYEGEHALLIPLRLPPGLNPGTRLPIRGEADYLVCTDKICVPEKAELALDLVVGEKGARPGRAARFDTYRQALPRPLGREARFEVRDGRFRLAVPIPAELGLTDPYFFPATLGALDHSAPQRLSRNGDFLIVEAGQPPVPRPLSAVEGVLKIGPQQGLALTARPGPVPAAGVPAAPEAPEQASGSHSLLIALLGAFVGGLLLNIMPCVFPILSLKALSLAAIGPSTPPAASLRINYEAKARREALAYAGGVILVCVALGALLLALRAGGATIGWAFQLQDPRVILFLLLLVTLIALNLAGLFELPGFGRGARLAGRGGSSGAFWTGALAAFVATPCTGPFMGAALGAALILPNAAALAVFAGLGLGLALPFLLLGFVPALRRRLPKPGPWMQRFRRLLSLPMFATALGLLWILWRQTGPGGLALGLASAVIVALVLISARLRPAWYALAGAGAAALAAILLVPTTITPVRASISLPLGAEPFSEARLTALTREGRPVFVYFTADWCLTCKVNEEAVLDRDDVAASFAARKVAVLAGDWTRGDAAIGRFLEKHGRSGVPLYLYYPPGKPAEVLPQILTATRLNALAA